MNAKLIFTEGNIIGDICFIPLQQKIHLLCGNCTINSIQQSGKQVTASEQRQITELIHSNSYREQQQNYQKLLDQLSAVSQNGNIEFDAFNLVDAIQINFSLKNINNELVQFPFPLNKPYFDFKIEIQSNNYFTFFTERSSNIGDIYTYTAQIKNSSPMRNKILIFTQLTQFDNIFCTNNNGKEIIDHFNGASQQIILDKQPICNFLPSLDNFQMYEVSGRLNIYLCLNFPIKYLKTAIKAAIVTRQLQKRCHVALTMQYRLMFNSIFYYYIIRLGTNCMDFQTAAACFGTQYQEIDVIVNPLTTNFFHQQNAYSLIKALGCTQRVPASEDEHACLEITQSAERDCGLIIGRSAAFILLSQLQLGQSACVYPLTLSLSDCLVVRNRFVTSALLVSTIFQKPHRYQLYTEDFQKICQHGLVQSFGCLTSAQIDNQNVKQTQPLALDPRFVSTIYYFGRLSTKTFDARSGAYAGFYRVTGLALPEGDEKQLQCDQEQLVSYAEARRIIQQYELQPMPDVQPSLYILVSDQPLDALAKVSYLNVSADPLADLNQSAHSLLLALKTLMLHMFSTDLNRRDLDEFAAFAFATRGMFDKSAQGKLFTLALKSIDDIKILLRGAALARVSEVGRVAGQYLALIGDVDFGQMVCGIFAEPSDKQRQLAGNVADLLMKLMNFGSEQQKIAASQLMLKIDPKIIVDILCFHQNEANNPIFCEVLAKAADQGISCCKAVIVHLAMFSIDYLTLCSPPREDDAAAVLLCCILYPSISENENVKKWLQTLFGCDDFASILLQQNNALCVKANIANCNLLHPTLSDQPSFELFELMQMTFSEVTTLTWNLYLKPFIARHRMFADDLYPTSDFQCLQCYFGSCCCGQASLIMSEFCLKSDLKRALSGLELSNYQYRGRYTGGAVSDNARAECYQHDCQTQPLAIQQLVTGRCRPNRLVEVASAKVVIIRAGEQVVARRVVAK